MLVGYYSKIGGCFSWKHDFYSQTGQEIAGQEKKVDQPKLDRHPEALADQSCCIQENLSSLSC